MKLVMPVCGVGGAGIGVAMLLLADPPKVAFGVFFAVAGVATMWGYANLKEVTEDEQGFVIRGWIREETIPFAALTRYELGSPRKGFPIGTLHFGRRKIRFVQSSDHTALITRLDAHLARNGVKMPSTSG